MYVMKSNVHETGRNHFELIEYGYAVLRILLSAPSYANSIPPQVHAFA
jgi:hypothetical protein